MLFEGEYSSRFYISRTNKRPDKINLSKLKCCLLRVVYKKFGFNKAVLY